MGENPLARTSGPDEICRREMVGLHHKGRHYLHELESVQGIASFIPDYQREIINDNVLSFLLRPHVENSLLDRNPPH